MKFSEDSLKSIITAFAAYVSYGTLFSFVFVFGSLLSHTQLQIVIQFHTETLFFQLKTFFGSETNFPIDSMKFLKCLT